MKSTQRPHRPHGSDGQVEVIDNPFDNRRPRTKEVNEASESAMLTIQYNDWYIWRTCRIAALQAIPMLLAQGRRTDVEQEAEKLNVRVRELLASLIDTDSVFEEETTDDYMIRVGVAQHSGPEVSAKSKNEFQFEVYIFYHLDSTNLYSEPSQYKRLATVAESSYGD